MGAVRMRVQTADKNITIIHTTPVHQLTSCDVTSWQVMFLTSNCCFWQKYESSTHNTAFSSEKVVWSESGEKYVQIKHLYKWKQFKTNMWVDFDVRGQQGMDYCDVFISCLDSHSDGTHSLQRIHWWASDAVLHFSKSDEETNPSTSWMAWGWIKIFSANLHSWVNYSFKSEAMLKAWVWNYPAGLGFTV